MDDYQVEICIILWTCIIILFTCNKYCSVAELSLSFKVNVDS